LAAPKMPHLLLAPLVAFACIAYVFRFPTPLGAVSLFRLVGLAYFAYALWCSLFARRVFHADGVPIRLFVGVGLIICPTVVDIVFFVDSPSLAAPIYAFWANLLFFVCFSLTVEPEDSVYYLKWYCYASVVETIIALYGHFSMEFPLGFLIQDYGSDYVKQLSMFNVNEDLVRLSGTFFDPNFYGIYLVSVIAISCWLFSYAGRQIFFLLVAGLSLYQLVLTGSRTAMLGLCGVIIAVVLMRKISLGKLVGLLCLLGFAGSLPLVFDSSLATQLTSSASVMERLEFFKRGIDAFMASPLWGSGSGALVDPVTHISTAHSVYLSILGRNGILGFLCFVLAVLIVLSPVIFESQARQSQREFVFQLLLMLGIFFIAYDILYFFEPLFFLFAMMLVFTKSVVRDEWANGLRSEGEC